jgi:hypothetical protein
MQESEIIEAIQHKIGSTDPKIWTIGITDDPERRKTEHDGRGENTKYWKDWKADTETIARNVEQHFLGKGMKGGPGGGERPTYVYVF